jgi:hypothetical protein
MNKTSTTHSFVSTPHFFLFKQLHAEQPIKKSEEQQVFFLPQEKPLHIETI